jgi:hypothetical protein
MRLGYLLIHELLVISAHQRPSKHDMYKQTMEHQRDSESYDSSEQHDLAPILGRHSSRRSSVRTGLTGVACLDCRKKKRKVRVIIISL